MGKIVFFAVIPFLLTGCLMATAGFMNGSKPDNFINRQFDRLTGIFDKDHVSDGEKAALQTCKPDKPDIKTPCVKGEKVKECIVEGWDSVTLVYSCVKRESSQDYYYFIYASKGDRDVRLQSDAYMINSDMNSGNKY